MNDLLSLQSAHTLIRTARRTCAGLIAPALLLAAGTRLMLPASVHTLPGTPSHVLAHFAEQHPVQLECWAFVLFASIGGSYARYVADARSS